MKLVHCNLILALIIIFIMPGFFITQSIEIKFADPAMNNFTTKNTKGDRLSGVKFFLRKVDSDQFIAPLK